MAKEQIANTGLDDNNVIAESGASEGSLTPGGGTGAGDIKMKTIADIVSALGSMGPDDLNGFKASLAQIGKEADKVPGGAEGSNRKSVETKPSYASMKGVIKEDLSKLFAGEQGEGDVLSEDFMDGVTTLFESALTVRVADEVETIEEQLRAETEQTIADLRESFATRLDTYLDYVAEEYIKVNRVAIEKQVRSELNEAFIADLRSVFESHNLDLPDQDVDVVADLQEQLEELKGQLNEAIADKMELQEEAVARNKAEVLATVVEGLADTHKDRMALLAEDIDFVDADAFREKMTTLKDSLFEGKVESGSGLILEDDQPVNEQQQPEPEGRMGVYSRAISRQITR